MKEHSKNILHKMTFGFALTGFILYAVAFSLPNWSKYTQPSTGTKFNYGLFATCFSTNQQGSTCNSIHISAVSGEWIWKVQLLGSIALAFYLGTVALLFLSFYWKMKVKRNLIYAGSVAGFFAGTGVGGTVFLYSNSNSGRHDAVDYCFFLALISIAPILIGAVLSVFNGTIVRLRRRRRKRDKDDSIRENLVTEKVFPPVDLEDPNITPGPSSLGDWDPDAQDADMLEEILEVDEKESGKSSEKINEIKDSDEESGIKADESDAASSKKDSISPAAESADEEEIPVPEITATVTFDAPAIERAQTTIPRDKVVDERATKSAAPRQKNPKNFKKYAILKWHCNRCPFEHTMAKPADELTPIEFMQVVKYVEGLENVMNYGKRDVCMPFVNNNRLPPVKREPRIGRRYVKKEGKEKDAAKTPEVDKTEDKDTERPESKSPDSRPKSSSDSQPQITPIEEFPVKASTEQIIQSASALVGDRQKDEVSIDSGAFDGTKDETNSESEELQTLFLGQSSNNTTESERKSASTVDRKSAHNERKSMKSAGLFPRIGDGTIVHVNDDVEEEDINEDTGNGPGLSDDEDDKSESKQADSFEKPNKTQSAGIFMSKASQKTYSAQNVKPLLKPGVLFKTLFEYDDDEKKEERRAKTSVPRNFNSLVGASNKSASLTKQRRTAKAQRVAVIRDKCKKCSIEVSFAKYADDLTEDEKTRIEKIVNRSELAQI